MVKAPAGPALAPGSASGSPGGDGVGAWLGFPGLGRRGTKSRCRPPSAGSGPGGWSPLDGARWEGGSAGGRGPGRPAGVRFGAEVSGHSVAAPFHDMTTLQN